MTIKVNMGHVHNLFYYQMCKLKLWFKIEIKITYEFLIKFNVSDEIRTGPYRSLFHPSQVISAKEDASNCYARGYYTLGRDILEEVLENIRKQVECCECIQSFFVFHSFGGGTGSGFTSLLLDHIASEFTSKSRLGCAVYPSPRVSCLKSWKHWFLASFWSDEVFLISYYKFEIA